MQLPTINYALYDVEIPSTKQQIKLRQILAKDEKLLLMAKASVGDVNIDILSAVRQVVQNCLITPGIDTQKLALFDIEYLFIKLRACSLSNIIEVAYQDNEEMDEYTATLNAERERLQLKPGQAFPLEVTNKIQPPQAYKFTIDLDKVTVKFPEDNPMVIDAGDGIHITLKYPDSSLYTNQAFIKSEGPAVLDFILQNSIKEIKKGTEQFDVSQASPEEITKFLNELPMAVYDKLRTFLSDLPTLYYEMIYTNKYGKERKIILQTLTDFFTF